MNKVIDPTSELDKLMMEDDDLSYLELKNIPDQVYNPLLNYPIDQPPTDPIQDTLNTMLDYNYLHFACKFILNVELLPFQLVILDTLWRKRLPMLIATRGGGKCVKGNTLCQTNNGLLRIDEIISKNSNILDKVPLSLEAMGELSFNKVEYGWNNGITKTIKIITSFGYEIEGTLNHPIRVLGQDGNLEWKELQYITNDDIIPISRKEYNFGNQEIFSKDIAWWIGATIGDGMVCRNNKISFTNIDKDIIIPWCEISENLSGKKVTKLKNGLSYDLYSKEFCTKVNEQWGLNYQKAHDKSIPRLIRESKKEIVASFIAGLFDTDGGCTPKGVEYTTVSEDLSIQVQSCLLAFGIISNRKVRYTKCNNKKFKSYRISIIGSNNLILFKNHIRFRCKRKQLKLELLCKKISNPNKDILKELKYIYDNHYLYDTINLIEDSENQTFDIHIPNDHSFIANGIINHNSFMLSVYALLRMVFHPGCRIVIVGAAFRQSRQLHDYMTFIWEKAPLLRDIAGKGAGPKREIDRCEFWIGDSSTYAIPLGTGEKIRGLRANYIFSDEFSCVGEGTIVETDKGLMRIEDCENRQDINLFTGDDNILEKPSNFIKTPLTDVYKITTANGYSFSCSSIHKVYTTDGWKLGKDLTSKDYLLFENNYKFPEKYINYYGFTVDEEVGTKLANISNYKEDYICIELGISDNRIPWSILQSPKSVVISFLQKLLQVDDIYTNFTYSTIHEQLALEIQILLQKLNVFSNKRYENSKWVLETNIDELPNSLQVQEVKLLPNKEVLYDFYLPQSHSFYGNGFRQHNSIPENIFSLVVQGFGIVSASPVDKVKQAATIRLLRQSGGWTEQMEADRLLNITGNQIVYSGTAYYSFNHFYRYFKKWHAIISSKGDMNKIKDLFGENEGSLDGFDWRDYAIIRLPYTQVPEGYLDAGILAQARATLHHSQFLQEYCAVFAADSSGFFRRSIIEATTTNSPILVPSGQSVQFSALRYGDKDRSYVIAVDPAADADNAAIVILELHKDHRRIVHCWTTNRKKYNQYKKAMKESKIDIQDDYYRYIAKKIRSLMRNFNTERIVMDKNGGGVAIQEALMSRDTYDDNEKPIYTIIDLENPKPEDIEEGIHILQLVVPTSEMNSEANHGMLKDLQDKILLFPMFDTIEMEKAIQLDKANSLTFDTYEDLVLEIEELKNEMTTIVVTPSSTLGREIFDTPLVKGEGARKGRLRKDRYSALLYANFYARNRNKTEVIKIDYKAVGGTKDTMKATVIQGTSMYRGPGLLKFNNSSWAKGSTKTTIFRKSR